MNRFTSSDGLKLAYRDEGQGLPVLALAGLTRDGRDFDYVAPHLTGIRLIRMDYRGRGASDWAPDPSAYSIPREALDALELMDHLGLDKAAVLGTSRGGIIAMTLAATARDRLIGVCLNDIGPAINPAGLGRIMDYLGRNPSFATQSEMAAAMPAFFPNFSDVTPARWADEVARHTRQTNDGLVITYDPKLRDAVEAAGAQPVPDLWPLFDALAGLPLALIRGANSDILLAKDADEMARRRPDMIRRDVPGRGHIPFLDEPQSIEALTLWLEKMG